MLAPFVFFARYLGGDAIPFGDDMLLLNVPLLSLLAHGLHAGYPILWNPYSGGGYPLAPFSALIFYPATWLLDLFSVQGAIGWTYALDAVVGGLGAYALAARVGVSPPARLIPTVAYPFSGFIMAHLFAGHFFEVGLMNWFPLSLAALHWALEGKGVVEPVWPVVRRGLLAGGPLGLLILANGVSWLVFVGYPLIVVALVLVVRTARREGARGVLRAMLVLAAAGLVALLLGAAVLLPLRDLLPQTVRGAALDYHSLTRTSEPLLGLVMTVSSTLFGTDAQQTYWFPNANAYFQEVYAYLGLPVLVLAALGALAGRRRPTVVLYAVGLLVCVVLALGSNTPIYLLVSHLPGLDLARAPARWMLPATLCASVLAGVGADAALNAARQTRPRPEAVPQGRQGVAPLVSVSPLSGLVLLGVLGLLALAGIVAAALLPSAKMHGAAIGDALAHTVMLVALISLVLVAVPRLPRALGAAVLLVLVLGDLWAGVSPLVNPLTPSTYYDNPAATIAATGAGLGRVWALDDRHPVPLRQGMRDRRTYDIQDFASLTLAAYWLLTNPSASLATVDAGSARSSELIHYDARTALLLGVSLVLSPHPLTAPGLVRTTVVPVPDWGSLGGDWSHPGTHPGFAYVYRVSSYLPRALLLPRGAVRVESTPVGRDAVRTAGFDPLHSVLEDKTESAPVAGLEASWRAWLQGRAGESLTAPVVLSKGVTELGRTENAVTLRVSARRESVLLLDQVYDPGWTADVDGRPVALQRADDVLTALDLPAGTHTVSLVYAPFSFALGGAATLLGYLILLVSALTYLRRGARVSLLF